MMILPLHGTLDHHDAIAVVAFALTLAMGSFLGSLRRRQRGEETAPTQPPADDGSEEGETSNE